MDYGYIRVSSREQNEDRQIIAMDRYGIPPERRFTDKQSGKDFERPAWRKLIRKLKKDDLLVIKSIDRMGRDYAEITDQWRVIVRERGADIYVLDMPLLDTRRGKDLLGTFLSDIVLQILSFVAENERESIRTRQAEGIAAAKAKGVKFGRPKKPLPPAFWDLTEQYRTGQLTMVEAAAQLNMSTTTFWRHYHKHCESV